MTQAPTMRASGCGTPPTWNMTVHNDGRDRDYPRIPAEAQTGLPGWSWNGHHGQFSRWPLPAPYLEKGSNVARHARKARGRSRGVSCLEHGSTPSVHPRQNITPSSPRTRKAFGARIPLPCSDVHPFGSAEEHAGKRSQPGTEDHQPYRGQPNSCSQTPFLFAEVDDQRIPQGRIPRSRFSGSTERSVTRPRAFTMTLKRGGDVVLHGVKRL
jgi:hypothetical protein